MFLDDTACNLASLNLLAVPSRGRRVRRRRVRARRPPVDDRARDLGVDGAVPGREDRRAVLRYRTLGPGLRQSRRPADGLGPGLRQRRRARALRRHHRADDRHRLRRLGRDGQASSGRSPATPTNRERDAAGASATIAARRDGDAGGYEELHTRRCRWTREAARTAELVEAARRAWDKALALGERHGFRNAQATVIAPTGTIGLVMDCDTTGIEPDFALVKFKKLAGGGYFKIINRDGAAGARDAGLQRSSRSRTIIRYAVGRGTLEGAPGIDHEALRAKGFTDEALATRRGGAADRVRHQVRVQQVDAGRGVLHGRSWARAEQQLADPGFDLLRGARLLARARSSGQHLLLRHDDGRRARRISRPSIWRCSTAPTRAAGSASASSRSTATSG